MLIDKGLEFSKFFFKKHFVSSKIVYTFAVPIRKKKGAEMSIKTVSEI